MPPLSPAPLSPIPFTDFGGDGPALNFLHANGYPPACYRPLISKLAEQHHVFGMHLRPLWPDQKPEDLKDWKPLSEDLSQFIDAQAGGRVIGVGHSIGAVVTLRTAILHPEKFSAIVLIDPVLFPPYFILGWNIARALGLGYRIHPLIPSAQRRRRKFDDLDKLFEGYRRRNVFRHFSDDSLRALIAGLTRPATDGGYELVYSPEWEVRIYYTGVSPDNDLWRGLRKLEVPTLIIRGDRTDTFFPSTGRRVQKVRPQTGVVTVENSTHLVPLEHPETVATLVQEFLDSIQ